MQSIYMVICMPDVKMRVLDKDDPKENIGQMQSSFKDFESKITPLTQSDTKYGGWDSNPRIVYLLNDFESFAFDHQPPLRLLHKYAQN